MAEDKNLESEEQQANSTGAEGSQVEELQKQAEKFKNEYLYLRAEFENYKRNVIKERSELLKYGSERVILDLLGAIDNFDRALEVKATAENLETYVKGVQMTATELKAVLAKNGVTEVKSEGVAFDPMVHEALGSEPTDAVPEGHILRVFKRAYKLHDKVIRAAQVIVGKAKG